MPRGFKTERLDEKTIETLRESANRARGHILKMTTIAGSGHPGGSMSSIDIYTILWACANVDPKRPHKADRDRIVTSHGHTSPGVYAALGEAKFFKLDDTVAGFRKAGSKFEGHVERIIPGVEWNTGNLGQGLSAACGFAMAAPLKKMDYHVFVAMGDGEQQKGQISEARRFATKYDLTNITVIVDKNELQISGSISDVMPQRIEENYRSDGWHVVEIDGHNLQEIYQALRKAEHDRRRSWCIIANTVMGKGVSFMEGKEKYHGSALTADQCEEALKQLGLPCDLDKYRKMREKIKPTEVKVELPFELVNIDPGTPRTYGAEEKTDNRSAFGTVLTDLAEINGPEEERTPIVVLDCDLAPSVKTNAFANLMPDNFFQGGIQEHNTATIAGAMSSQGVLAFFADFGVFGVDETYNQHRLNDINSCNLKLVCTHNGLDVGEDGKTHQCIDYTGVISNLFGYRIIIPADPNQTDRAIRYVAQEYGNFFVGMGRSKMLPVLDEKGDPLFGGDYKFRYGKADWVRDGSDAAIITMGSMWNYAVKAHDILKEQGHKVAVVNMSCPSDPDIAAVKKAARTGAIITYEDHNVHTGLGSTVGMVIADEYIRTKFRRLGVRAYACSGASEEVYKICGLDVDSLVKVVTEEIAAK